MDSSNIVVPSSTKNRTGERDPDMHQTKKCNQWHFRTKAHVGVDSETGIVHSMTATPANAHDDYGGAQSAARGGNGGVG